MTFIFRRMEIKFDMNLQLNEKSLTQTNVNLQQMYNILYTENSTTIINFLFFWGNKCR